MRVAFVCQPLDGKLPPPKNSIGIIIYEFARKLAGQVDAVSVFCYGNRFRGKTVEQEGVRYYHLPVFLDGWCKRLLQKFRKGGNPRAPYFASPWSSPVYAWRIARQIRKQRMDVVHIINCSEFVPVIRALNPEVKIVLHMECEWLSQLSAPLMESRIDKTDLVLGCSEFVTRRIQERFPKFRDRCDTIFNGIDAERFCTSGSEREEKEPLVMFVGRVSPEKGVHIVLDAMAEVVETIPNARLEVIGQVQNVPAEYVVDISDDPLVLDLSRFYGPGGSGEYEAALRAQIQERNLEKNVDFVGNVPNSELQDKLRKAAMLVFPSVWEEPFGIPPVEGMAMGMPVIVTRSGGMTETVLHEETGLVVDRNDAGGLADAILRLLKDPELCRQFGVAGQKRAQAQFSYQGLSEDLLRLYRAIPTRRVPARPETFSLKETQEPTKP